MVKKQELSYDLKFVIVLVLLFTLYPVGLILMFKWMAWPKWVKIVISLPILIILLVFAIMFLIAFSSTLNVGKQVDKAQQESQRLDCSKKCTSTEFPDFDGCVENCLKK